MVHKWAAAATLAAMGAALPAQVQAHCWNEREASAAQVRELQIKLMVATLRCRAARMDITADYDDFVASQRGAIDHASFVIKQHFAAEGGTQADYDRFGTSLANGYGDDPTTDGACAEAAMVAHDAAMIAPAALEPFAAARLFPADLPGGRCGMMPVSAPVAAPLPVVMAAAAPLEPRAPRIPANLPITRPEPAPIIPIDDPYIDPVDDQAPVAVAQQAAPAPTPVAVAQAAPVPVAAPVVLAQAMPVQGPSLPADVLAAMAVMARYQQSLQAQAPLQR